MEPTPSNRPVNGLLVVSIESVELCRQTTVLSGGLVGSHSKLCTEPSRTQVTTASGPGHGSRLLCVAMVPCWIFKERVQVELLDKPFDETRKSP